MSKKNTPPSMAKNPAAAAAEKRHREIVAHANELFKKWTSLARECLEFKKAEYYKLVINAETGKPFQSFAAWAKFVFGKSKSTIFAATRILRELDGIVADDDINAMSKENAETLVRAKAAGELMTPELVEAAKTEPAKELCKKIASVRRIDEKKKAAGNTRNLGPYSVSTETADEFERALAVAAEKTAGSIVEETDRSISFLARTFLDQARAGGTAKAQEVAA